MEKEFDLEGIVPWGRTYDEYCAFFDLGRASLPQQAPLLDVGAGPSGDGFAVRSRVPLRTDGRSLRIPARCLRNAAGLEVVMTILVLGTLRFPKEKLKNVRPHLHALVKATREHDGCLAYNVAEDIFEPGLIRFSEMWPDGGSLEAHLRAPHIAPWRRVCQENGLMERNFTAFDGANPRPV